MPRMDDQQLQRLIDSYEQFYFTHDDPVPFKGKLKIYPVLVKDYYKFYSTVSLFTQNKNEDPTGKGIAMTHLDYLIMKTEQEYPNHEENIFSIITMFELIFRIKNGLKCEDCGEETYVSWDEIHDILIKAELAKKNKTGKAFEEEDLYNAFNDLRICPICGKNRQEVIRFNSLQNGKKDFIVDGIEITSDDFDLLRKVIAYQNMPDYDDEYIDPDLKADLEEQARLENPNNIQPTLEKQETCIIAATSYTYETIKELSIRHLVLLLRTVDAKLHYFCYRQAEASGMVKFEKDAIKHWIYAPDKQSKYSKLKSLDSFKEKMANVAI